MNFINDILMPQIKLVQGKEGDLLRRNRKGNIGGIAAIAGLFFEIVLLVIENPGFDKIKDFFTYLLNFNVEELKEYITFPELLGMLAMVFGIGTYVILKRTGILLKESAEPFRYTFWVKSFKNVKNTKDESSVFPHDSRLDILLNHDLREKINKRIQRFSLLDDSDSSSVDKQSLTSHIHISGNYAIREEKNGDWYVYVTPCVRIGPPGRPEILANPVKYRLDHADTNNLTPENFVKASLTAEKYDQIVERVYSSVATEIYRQIFIDMKEKLAIFPTNYLRAVALFYEAKDFERSNTIDAYDYAVQLYRDSKRYFDIRINGGISQALLKSFFPLFWRLSARSKILEARTRTGYSRCLIYRRILSALSGRRQNPIFEVPDELQKAIGNLKILHNKINRKWRILKEAYSPESQKIPKKIEPNKANQYNTVMAFLTFQKDSPFHRKQFLFDRQRESLFEAYTVNALAYYHLGAIKKAGEFLERAKAVDPVASQENPLWLLSAAEIEPDINQALLLLRKATELASDFEIAQYRLAYYSEMRLRMRKEMEADRVKSVVAEYEAVLRINPGNVGAIAAQGYLYWLISNGKDSGKSKEKFEQGLEIKAVYGQTFIGDLNYGLARIAAENGEFDDSYNLYLQAISSDPGVAAYSGTVNRLSVSAYYEYMVPDIYKRYEKFKTNVEGERNSFPAEAKKSNEDKKENAHKTRDAVYSFVLNDYGNACINYYFRFGDEKKLKDAINAYEEAIKYCPENAVAYYNLAKGCSYYKENDDKVVQNFEHAEELAPDWTQIRVDSIQMRVRQIQSRIDKADGGKRDQAEEDKKKRIEDVIKKYDRELQAEKDRKKITDDQDDRNKYDERFRNLENIIRKKKKELESIEIEKETKPERKDLQEKLKLAFGKIKTIMDKAKFISMFEGLDINYDGNGIKELCGKKLKFRKDILNEDDIYILRALAELLTNNSIHTALSAAEKLCSKIQEYYPEDFDTYLILERIYRKFYSGFNGDEFKSPLINIEKLCKAINDDNYDVSTQAAINSIDWLNEFLRVPKFYDMLHDKKSNINFSENIMYLVDETEVYRNKSFSDLNFDEKSRVERLNRLLLQEAYPQETPKSSVIVKLDDCHKKISDCIENDSKRDPIHYNILNWTKDYFDFNKGIEVLKEALELEPNNEAYLRILSGVFAAFAEKAFKMNKLKDFENKFNTALDALLNYNEKHHYDDVKAWVYNRIGNLYYERYQDKDAFFYYTKATEFGKDLPIYECNLGRTYGSADQQEWDKMIEHCQRAVDLCKLNPDTYGLDYYYEFLAEGYFRAGKLEKFEREFKDSGDLKDIPEKKARVYNRIGNLYYESYKDGDAISCYIKATTLDNETAIYECNLGKVYGKIAQWDKMIEHCQRAIDLWKRNPDTYGLEYYYKFLAEGYFRAGKSEEFEGEFETSGDLKDTPEKKARVYNRIGNLYYESYKDKEAILYYTKATELDNETPIYECNLGRTYGKADQPDKWVKMVKHCRRAIDLWKRNPDTYGLDYYYEFLAEGYFGAGKLEKFERKFETSGDLKDTPEKKARVYNRIGKLLYESYKDKEAIIYYTKATELDNETPIYECNLGRTYGSADQPEWDKMIEHCQRAIDLWKRNPDTYGLDYYYEFLAEGYLKAKKLEEFVENVVDEDIDSAMSALILLLKQNPDNPEINQAIDRSKARKNPPHS